jgi:hypothetical protein
MPIIMASQSKTAEHRPSPKGEALKIRGLKPKKRQPEDAGRFRKSLKSA